MARCRAGGGEKTIRGKKTVIYPLRPTDNFGLKECVGLLHERPTQMQTTSQEQGAVQDVFLTGPQVQRRYQKSHVSIWRWMNDEALGFPAPIKINRLNYWRLDDLKAWESQRAAATTTHN